jgi:hypothetical protein
MIGMCGLHLMGGLRSVACGDDYTFETQVGR